MTPCFPHRYYAALLKTLAFIGISAAVFIAPGQSYAINNQSNFEPQGKTSSLASSTLGLKEQNDFLPVHEAYQLAVDVEADKLLLHWSIAEGYFLYGDQFHFELTQHGTPVSIDVKKDVGEIAYDEYFEREVERFRHNTTHIISLPKSVTANGDTLLLKVGFQGCAEAGLCYPPETLAYSIDLSSLTASNADNTPAPDANNAASPAPGDSSTHASFALMFAFALLGGLILNLMPCVFPVLSIKLLSFTRSTQSESHLREHSWFYTLGVITTFFLTALLLILLRKTGATIGWGFQLQSPVFVASLALLFLVLGLSMSDFISIGTRFMGVGQNLTAGNHYSNSFFTGVLTVIVASPCSVPFMGIALGYALTQPTTAALIIFLGLGMGLASPFLLFAYVPWLIQHLPKPGPWMEKLKHWLALPLYLSTIWLLWVLWHQLATPTHKAADTNQYWEKYSAQTLSSYLDKNEPVFIELTADWCITCLVNEKTALTRSAVIDTMKKNQVHYLRGDWTNRDPEISALLKQYQRGGVPLYIYHGKDKTVTVLPQILTEQTMLDTLQN